jgi:hypothetical protein
VAKSDWNITGSGGYIITEDGGSKRCQITTDKLLLWNGRSDLANCEIVYDFRTNSTSTNCRGGAVLRSDGTLNNCYRIHTYGPRNHYLQKVVNGVVTTLGTVSSPRDYDIYVKTRFRIDGYQLSIEEYVNGNWTLLGSLDDTSQALSSGSAGIFGAGVGGYVVYFDNIEIRERL